MKYVAKVCVITTVHQAYDGRIYHKQCKSLLKAGYEVVLIAPRPENIVHEGIEILPIDKPKKEWKRILHTFTVIKMALKTKADIFHFHDPELIPSGFIIRLLSRKSVIFDVHEHYPNAIMSKKYLRKQLKLPIKLMYELLEFLLLPFLSGVIFTTKEIGERYKKYTSCKIENYPPKTLFAKEQTEKDPNLLLYLGGITEIRGIRQLVYGFSLVRENNPDAKLLLVGGFENDQFEKEIHDQVAKLGLTTSVLFKGKVPYEKVQLYMKEASIGIIPYLPEPNHLVCLPNKLFEYMASGIAVIASDFPHYREVVENSDSGLLVNPEESKSIANGILQLLHNKERTREMQENGRKMFENTYNWEEEGIKLLHFYDRLLPK